MPESPSYRFGPFLLQPGLRQLVRGSEELTLPPKAFDVLVFLVRNRIRVVPKQELLDAVWGDTAVTENTLTQRIKEVREALQDEAQEPKYVRTMSRVGYRFVADVIERVESEHPVEATVAQPPRPTDGVKTWAHRAIYAAAAVIVAAGGLVAWFSASSGSGNEAPRHQLLSTFEGSHRSASLSPDGRMFAFLMDVEGVPQIWIKSIDVGAPVQITTGEMPAGRPRWSPRGDQIVFERRAQGIWSVPPLGGAPRQLIENGRSPNFSADGSMLVFERGGAPIRWGIWLAGSDGGNPRRVEGTPEKVNWAEPTYPAMSPDGEWIAFFRQTDGPRGDIWVVRSNGGDARPLTRDERQGGPPVWTPDGRAVIFPSERRGSRTLWRAAIADGSLEPLTTGAGADDEPEVSRDGRSMIYTNYKDRHALSAWDPATRTHTATVERPVPFNMPNVSPRGDRVAFFMQTGADVQIFTVGIDGRGWTQLTHGSGHENVHPSWSWDGRFVYYYRHKPEAGWRRIGVDGSGDTEIVKGWRWETHSNAQIDRKGRQVLYTRVGYDTGDFSKDTTYVFDIASASQRALDAPHLHMARWSPDSRFAAGFRHDGTVGVCDIANGKCRTLSQGTRPRWSADGSAVYVERSPTSSHAEWWRIAIDGSGERPLGTIGPFHPGSPNVDVTPDGHVVFAEFEPGRRELWLRDLR